jgi:hypothetical protein
MSLRQQRTELHVEAGLFLLVKVWLLKLRSGFGALVTFFVFCALCLILLDVLFFNK